MEPHAVRRRGGGGALAPASLAGRSAARTSRANVPREPTTGPHPVPSRLPYPRPVSDQIRRPSNARPTPSRAVPSRPRPAGAAAAASASRAAFSDDDVVTVDVRRGWRRPGSAERRPGGRPPGPPRPPRPGPGRTPRRGAAGTPGPRRRRPAGRGLGRADRLGRGLRPELRAPRRRHAALSANRPTPGSGTNYVLVGSDSRVGLTKAQRKALSTGTAVGQRTDSIMLVHLPGNGGEPTPGVDPPRQLRVRSPGHYSNKINASYSYRRPPAADRHGRAGHRPARRRLRRDRLRGVRVGGRQPRRRHHVPGRSRWTTIRPASGSRLGLPGPERQERPGLRPRALLRPARRLRPGAAPAAVPGRAAGQGLLPPQRRAALAVTHRHRRRRRADRRPGRAPPIEVA